MSPKRRASPTAAALVSDFPDGSDAALGVGSPMLAPETEYATGEREGARTEEVEELHARLDELEARLSQLLRQHTALPRPGGKGG
jgi:hypothetical protein